MSCYNINGLMSTFEYTNTRLLSGSFIMLCCISVYVFHTHLFTVIKSRHEMGCMMTVRMLTQTNEVIWVNTVMHVRQALVSNNDDPVIVCINQVVR